MNHPMMPPRRKAAFDAGASHIVIGRPITQADDPVEAFLRIAVVMIRNLSAS